MKYDVIIVGAGPGGIFSSYELVKLNPNLKIAVFESGYSLEKRHCPIDGDKVKNCIKCKTCAIMSGFGGAGAFSDGKYNITNDFGGTLYEYIGRKEAMDLMKYVDEINVKHGGEGTKMYSTAGTGLKKVCMQNKLKLLDASVRHLGTDINYVVLENLYAELKDKVDFHFHTPVSSVEVMDGGYRVVTEKESYEKYWDDINPFIKYGCLKDDKFFEKMKDYILFKNLDGKYLTLPECLEENKEKHENTVFYVKNETEQGQYIKMFKEAGLDAVILTHNIDSAFINHLEQKNEGVKFLSIDSDLTETFKEEQTEDEAKALKEREDKLSDVFKKALGNDKLAVKLEKLKNDSIASMITVSEDSKRMQDMMKMYGMYGMNPSMFGQEGQTLVLNAKHPLVQYVENNPEGENTALFCEQLYDLAELAHAPLNPERMSAFIERSNKLMEIIAK